MGKSFAYWSIGMGIFLIFGALAILFFPPAPIVQNPGMRIPVVIVMLLYGGFRFYRAVKMIRDEDN